MIMLTLVLVLSGLFLGILGYGIWNDFKQIDALELLKAEREARKYNNVNMTPVV